MADAKRTLNRENWYAVGLASVLAAVLASLQTFLGYSERAEKHRVAGAKYGAIGRELEVMLRSQGEAPSEPIARLIDRLNSLALESPNNPQRIYNTAGGAQLERKQKKKGD